MALRQVSANLPKRRAGGHSQTVAVTGTAGGLPAGQVTATDNPQVALYSMTLPFPGSMTVSFGTSSNYGFKTWSKSTDIAGGHLSIFVAGMQASTPYHVQASESAARHRPPDRGGKVGA